jgi:hypothetical protein
VTPHRQSLDVIEMASHSKMKCSNGYQLKFE